MLLTIHIKDKQERINFAQKVRQLLGQSQTYIPGARKVYNADIGIKANANDSTYKKILGLIDRNGYSYNIIKE
jgi:hypothetical protein|tara:strand:- start:808 stop:1026 length:219 start_codon:yes stop_codon:yes gene_type:complete